MRPVHGKRVLLRGRARPSQVDEPRKASSHAAGEPSNPSALTRRQHDVLDLVAAGENDKRIAHALGISERTVRAHIVKLVHLLGARSRAHAVAIAYATGEFIGQRASGPTGNTARAGFHGRNRNDQG